VRRFEGVNVVLKSCVNLSELCVRGFITPRAPRMRRLIKVMKYVEALVSFA